LKITKISKAKRHRKRDENQKVIDTYHERDKHVGYNFDQKKSEQFYNEFSQDQAGEQLKESFQSWQ